MSPAAQNATAPTPWISVVMAALNEEENLGPLVGEIAAALDGRIDYEIVITDDASTDGSVALLEGMMKDPDAPAAGRLRVMRHQKTSGKSAGVMTAAKAARGTLLVLMDADRQNDPQDIPQMIAAFEAGGGLGVVGAVDGQRKRRRDTVVKRLSSRSANAIRRSLLNDKTRDTGCGLKLVPRSIYVELPFFEGMHRYIPALVGRMGYGIALQPVNDRPRVAGVSKYGFWNRLWVGIGDLLMVWWLIRRYRNPGEISEVAEPSVPHRDATL